MSKAVLPTIKTEVAFANGPQDAAPVWVDISAYVLPGRTGRRGRSSESDTTQTGTRNIRLRNVDGRFDPTNAASPYMTGGKLLKPMRPIRQTATLPSGASAVVFSGFVLGWPQNWTMHGRYGEAQIQCVDVFRALAGTKFGLRYFEQVIADHAAVYTRYNELAIGATITSGSRTWINVGSNGNVGNYYDQLAYIYDGNVSLSVTAPLVGADAAITFTAGASGANKPLGSGQNVQTYLTYVGASSGSYPGVITSGQAAFEMWWKPNSIPTSTGYIVIAGSIVDTASNPPAFGTSAGFFVEARFAAGGAGYYIRDFTDTSSPRGVGFSYGPIPGVVPTAGRADHIVVNYSAPAGNPSVVTYDVYVNGAFAVTYTGANSTNHTAPLAFFPYYSNLPAGFSCSVDEVAYYSAKLPVATIANHANYKALAGDFPQQLPGLRVAGVLDAIGWPSTRRALDTGTVPLAATGSLAGKTALEVLQATADAEIGNVFASASGNVVFTDRNHAYTSSPAFTLGDGPGEYPYLADLSIGYDEQRIVNDWAVTQEGSDPIVATRLTDAASALDYFPRSDSKTFPYANSADISTAAAYLLARTKDPHPRIEQVTLDIAANPDLLPLYLGLEIGQWIRINRRPPYAPKITVDCIVEQISETADTDVLKLTLSLSPKL